MKSEKQVSREVMSIQSAINAFRNVLFAKGEDFDLNKIFPLVDALEDEVVTQAKVLIGVSKVKTKPRTAKVILAEIAISERLTPELLDEIKRSQK